MAYNSLGYRALDGIAWMTFQRPDTLNSLTDDVLKEMSDILDHISISPEIRVLVITGSGRGFCSGADLRANRQRKRTTDSQDHEHTNDSSTYGQRFASKMARHANPVTQKICQLPKPVIASVNGVAAGAGVGIALSADIVIAARSAEFVLVFGPRLGIMPDMGCTWLIPRLIGRARALGLMLLGEKLPAEAAEAWGLIWKCVDDDRLTSETENLARTLSAGPTFAFGLIKDAIMAASGNSLTEQLDLEALFQGKCLDTRDAREGIIAFLEKRAPGFKGF